MGRSAPGSVAISPDGTTVAWTLRGREGLPSLHLTAIADPDPAKEKLVTPNGATNCSNDAPVLVARRQLVGLHFLLHQ